MKMKSEMLLEQYEKEQGKGRSEQVFVEHTITCGTIETHVPTWNLVYWLCNKITEGKWAPQKFADTFGVIVVCDRFGTTKVFGSSDLLKTNDVTWCNQYKEYGVLLSKDMINWEGIDWLCSATYPKPIVSRKEENE